MRVYVAGPISKGNVVANIRSAIDAAESIRQAGHFPFVPHLTTFTWYFLHIDKLSLDDTSWSDWNLSWLECCDILVRLPGESIGSDREVAFAKSKGIPVMMGITQLFDYFEDK